MKLNVAYGFCARMWLAAGLLTSGVAHAASTLQAQQRASNPPLSPPSAQPKFGPCYSIVIQNRGVAVDLAAAATSPTSVTLTWSGFPGTYEVSSSGPGTPFRGSATLGPAALAREPSNTMEWSRQPAAAPLFPGSLTHAQATPGSQYNYTIIGTLADGRKACGQAVVTTTPLPEKPAHTRPLAPPVAAAPTLTKSGAPVSGETPARTVPLRPAPVQAATSAESTAVSSSVTAQIARSNSNALLKNAPVPHAAPTGFTAKHLGGGAVKLDWQPVSGASQYRLEGPTLPPTGYYVPTSTLGVTLNGVSPGPRSWKIAAVYAESSWDPNLTATASAMVRYPPSHSVPWLSKLGAGNSATALHHYLSLCPECVPGIDWNTFLQKIGGVADRIGFECSGGSYDLDCPEPPYVNVTDLGSKRSTACYLLTLAKGTPLQGKLCYSNSDSGRTVIVKRPNAMWFLAFTAHSPGGPLFLTDRVVLDSEGAKFPPHACMGCHGGRTTATGVVSDATLLPLDPGLLEISPVTTYENGTYYPNTHPKEWVAEKLIRPLNAVVIRDSAPAVARYVRGIYGNDLRGATNLDFVPQGWASQASIYRQVIKPHCLMCHLPSTSTVDLSSWDAVLRDRQRIYASVCTTRSMPNAEIPYKNFWTKDTGPFFLPGVLAAALGYQNCP